MNNLILYFLEDHYVIVNTDTGEIFDSYNKWPYNIYPDYEYWNNPTP